MNPGHHEPAAAVNPADQPGLERPRRRDLVRGDRDGECHRHRERDAAHHTTDDAINPEPEDDRRCRLLRLGRVPRRETGADDSLVHVGSSP